MSDPTALVAVRAAFAQYAGSPCGPDDNFFAIGGNSFNAAICVHELRRIGHSVSLRDLFECKTAAELAARIDSRRGQT